MSVVRLLCSDDSKNDYLYVDVCWYTLFIRPVYQYLDFTPEQLKATYFDKHSAETKVRISYPTFLMLNAQNNALLSYFLTVR